MINDDRIVQVSNTDLISLYGLILTLTVGDDKDVITELEATNPAEFSVTAAGTYLANEPVGTLDFSATSGTVYFYFVAAYDFSGFTISGEATETTGETVEADARTLYKATLSSGSVTIAKIGF